MATDYFYNREAAAPGLWARLVLNSGGTVYTSPAPSKRNGQWTVPPPVPPGHYSLYSSPDAINWYLEDPDYVVNDPDLTFLNPMTTQDDLVVAGLAGAPTRLAKGSDGQVLTVDPVSHHVGWGAGSGITNPMTAQDDIFVGAAAGAPARLAKGADGQVLFVDPATHHLGWESVAEATVPGLTADLARKVSIPGGRLISFGQSAANGAFAGNPTLGHIHRVGALLRATVNSWAIGGATVSWSQQNNPPVGATGDGGWAWVWKNALPAPPAAGYSNWPAQPGIFVLQWGLNDLGFTKQLQGYLQAMRAVTSRVLAAAVYPCTDGSVVSSGAWALATDYNSSVGTILQGGVNGDTITISVPSTFPGGTVALGVRMRMLGDGTPTFTVDGGAVVPTGPASLNPTQRTVSSQTTNTFTLVAGAVPAVGQSVYLGGGTGDEIATVLSVAGQVVTTNANLAQTGHTTATWQPMVHSPNSSPPVLRTNATVYRFPGLTAGAHTIVVTVAGRGAAGTGLAGFDFDSWWVAAPTPPIVVATTSYHPPNAGLTAWGLTPAPTQADIDTWNTALVGLYGASNEFPSVLVADYSAVLGPVGGPGTASYFAPDSLHPTAQGHSLLAKTLYATILTSPLLTDTTDHMALSSGFFPHLRDEPGGRVATGDGGFLNIRNVLDDGAGGMSVLTALTLAQQTSTLSNILGNAYVSGVVRAGTTAVNMGVLAGGVAGSGVSLSASSFSIDTNVDVKLVPKGTGKVQITPQDPAAVGAEIKLQAAATGHALDVSSSTGTGDILSLSAGGQLQVASNVFATGAIRSGTGAGNMLTASGAAAGSPVLVLVSSLSADANVDMLLQPKGTGKVSIQPQDPAATGLEIKLKASPAAAALNVSSSTGTGDIASLGPSGLLTLANNLYAGGVVRAGAAGGNLAVVSGNAAGSAVIVGVSSVSADTDVDVNLTPKGAGKVHATGNIDSTGMITETTGRVVTSVVAGTGVAVTGAAPNPTVGVAGGGVTSTQLAAGAVIAGKITAGTIVDADISGTAAIAKTKLAALAIVDADVAAGAAIAKTKLAALAIVDADISAGAAIANSKLATNPLARANHTGTQLAATISDFDTQVRTSRLDQMAAPTVDLSVNSHKLTNVTDPTVDGDAATYTWVRAHGLYVPSLRPTAAIAETFDRSAATAVATGTITSGTERMTAIWLPKGKVITSISVMSGSTALAGGTHAWFALHDSSLNLLRQSTDDTTPTWAASTLKSYNLSSTFTTTYAGLHYIGVLVVATTMPTLKGIFGDSGLWNLPPVLAGNSSTGLTTTAPNPAAAVVPGANTILFYAYVA